MTTAMLKPLDLILSIGNDNSNVMSFNFILTLGIVTEMLKPFALILIIGNDNQSVKAARSQT